MNWFSQKEPEPEMRSEDIVSKYLSTIDDEYLDYNINDETENMNVCQKCQQSTMIFKLNESEMYCQHCGYTENVLLAQIKHRSKIYPEKLVILLINESIISMNGLLKFKPKKPPL